MVFERYHLSLCALYAEEYYQQIGFCYQKEFKISSHSPSLSFSLYLCLSVMNVLPSSLSQSIVRLVVVRKNCVAFVAELLLLLLLTSNGVISGKKKD